MLNYIKADLERYVKLSNKKLTVRALFYFLFTQGVWAIVIFRFGSSCSKLKLPLISQILRLIYFFLNKLIEILTGISISSKALIGKGLYIGHFGGIFINESVVIGENCSLGQGITIGSLGLGKKGTPKIGNNVFIGVGAKILGDIVIGDNVKIGANAVVIDNIPSNSTAVGIPAKVVKTDFKL